MTALAKKALGYVLVFAGGVALTLVLLAVFLPSARVGILRGLAGVGGVGAIIGGIFGAKKIKETAETVALDAEVEKARLKAEEEERAKINSAGPGDAMDNLSAAARERIAQAGRDAVAAVIASRKR
jgi:hypothetical protein